MAEDDDDAQATQPPRRPPHGSDASVSDAENQTPEPDNSAGAVAAAGTATPRSRDDAPQDVRRRSTRTRTTPKIYALAESIVNSAQKKRNTTDSPTSTKKKSTSTATRARPPTSDSDLPTDDDGGDPDSSDSDASASDPDFPKFQARGRGRPRKDAGKQAKGKPHKEEETPKAGGRGRGRPRGSLGKNKGSATKAKKKRAKGEEDEGEENGEETEDMVTAAGRKRMKTEVGEREGEEEVPEGMYAEVLDPNTSLETTVSEWVKTYRADSVKGMLELVNFLIHSCGCNSSISPAAFAEEDAVVDILQELQQELQKDPFHDYPIVSRARQFKKFRRQFLDFWIRLIDQCRHDVVYDGVFCETLQEWLTAMSSSTFRPFRHTATATALCLVGALCDVAGAVEGELDVATRQLQAERKKRGEKTRVGEREQGLVDRSQDLQGKKVKLGEVLTDFFDGVFVHRCRDVEPIIRSECIHDLGAWMIKHPSQFLDASYLRYLGWLLSDKSSSVRLEAIRSLEKLYLQENFVTSLRQFTERFRGRVIEMAVGEADITIRIVAIKVCETISELGLLEDTEKEALCPLVFEAEEKVRSAVSGFVKGVVKEDWVAGKSLEVERLLKGKKKKDGQVRKDWIELKGLAAFFVKFDGSTGREKDGEEEEMNGKKRKRKDAAKDIVDDAYVEGGGSRRVGRIAEAVEALWWEMNVLRDWETLADYLSRDHSTSQAAQSSSASTPIDPCYRLTDEEESVLVEVFVACLKLAIDRGNEKEKAKEKKKVEAQQEDIRNIISRHMVRVLPSLLTKYAPDASRIAQIVTIPQFMNLEVYVDLRMKKAYEQLLDDIARMYTRHTSLSVLYHAARTLHAASQAESLSSSNEARMPTLMEEVVKGMKEACEGMDIPTAHFKSDNLRSIAAALARVEHLISVMDLTGPLEEETDQALDLVGAIVERGGLGYEEEEKMVVSGINVLWSYLLWKCRAVQPEEPGHDASTEAVAELLERRERIVDRFSELAVGSGVRVVTGARRAAFKALGDTYWLFSNDLFDSKDAPNLGGLYLACPAEVQERCAALVEMEVERWAERVEEEGRPVDESGDEEDDDGGEKRKKAKQDAPAKVDPAELFGFRAVLGELARLVMLDVFHVSRCAVVLAQFGRFGSEVDDVVRVLIERLKDNLATNDVEQNAVCKVYAKGVKESFELYMDRRHATLDPSLQLARLLVHTLKTGDGSLAAPRVSPQHLVDLHRDGITYVVSKAAGYQHIKNSTGVGMIIKFFKVLAVFLQGVALGKKEAGLIFEHLQSAIQDNKIEVTENSKDWDPYFLYRKNLEKIIAKAGPLFDPTSAAKRLAFSSSTGVRRKSAATVGSEDDEGPGANSPTRSRGGPASAVRDLPIVADADSDEERLVDKRKNKRLAPGADDTAVSPSKKRKQAGGEAPQKVGAGKVAEEKVVALRGEGDENEVREKDEEDGEKDEEDGERDEEDGEKDEEPEEAEEAEELEEKESENRSVTPTKARRVGKRKLSPIKDLSQIESGGEEELESELPDVKEAAGGKGRGRANGKPKDEAKQAEEEAGESDRESVASYQSLTEARGKRGKKRVKR